MMHVKSKEEAVEGSQGEGRVAGFVMIVLTDRGKGLGPEVGLMGS